MIPRHPSLFSVPQHEHEGCHLSLHFTPWVALPFRCDVWFLTLSSASFPEPEALRLSLTEAIPLARQRLLGPCLAPPTPPLSFENCQRTLWLLALLLVLGQEPVFCPELHLMISVCAIDGLRLCAERGVRLVTVPRGESAPALCVLVRGGRARPVRSSCCRDDVPAPAPVGGSLLGS